MYYYIKVANGRCLYTFFQICTAASSCPTNTTCQTSPFEVNTMRCQPELRGQRPGEHHGERRNDNDCRRFIHENLGGRRDHGPRLHICNVQFTNGTTACTTDCPQGSSSTCIRPSTLTDETRRKLTERSLNPSSVFACLGQVGLEQLSSI